MDNERMKEVEVYLQGVQAQLSKMGVKSMIAHLGLPRGLSLSLIAGESEAVVKSAFDAQCIGAECVYAGYVSGEAAIKRHERYNMLIRGINNQLEAISAEHYVQAITGCADESNPRYVETRRQYERLIQLSAQLSDKILSGPNAG